MFLCTMAKIILERKILCQKRRFNANKGLKNQNKLKFSRVLIPY